MGKITLPEWIPSCEVSQHQTALMELQHSFSKTAVQKHLCGSVKGERKKSSQITLLRERNKRTMVSMLFYFFN